MTLAQLRVKSEFSFRETFGPLQRIAERLVAVCAPAAGIVDTTGTWGHVRWERALKDTFVKPLFGREFTVKRGDGMRPVAWALAEDSRLFYRFSSELQRRAKVDEQFDMSLLAERREGVLVFAGAALDDPDTFDYIDINPASLLQQRKALLLAQHTGKPLVVTGDNSYPAPEDRDRFLAIADRQKVTPQWILSQEELRAALKGLTDEQWERALINTQEAAERASVATLRRAPLIHVEGDLRELALEGKSERLAKGHISEWTEAYEKRLEHELEIIALKKFESYFLVVSDLIRWAKQRMLVGPGRGSSAGSLVCYLTSITEVDPLVHDLMFERFIDITRNDLPDVDVDFSDVKRELLFDYLAQKYGRENVARIGNINTLKARSAMAEVGKRLGIPHFETWDVKNVLIEYSSGDSRFGKGLEDTLQGTEAGRAFMERFPEAKIMAEVEGHAWHSGVHAAGVIVATEPVIDYCTVGADGVAQADKPDTERLNLLKIDALGLRTLGIIEDSGVVTADELYALKLDDPGVLKLMDEGKFCSVFQFEGSSQRSVSNQLKFESFETIDHATALARPGPLGGGATNHYILRQNGKEDVAYRHAALESILAPTYGVILYQEQVMRICREIGQFSWELVAQIRKTMSGRKGKEYFDKVGDQFVVGAATMGFSEADAREIWDELCNYGAWCMNRCLQKDVRVKLAHVNQSRDMPGVTMEELYRRYKVSPSKWMIQNKRMPIVLAYDESEGSAKPVMALDVHKTGSKDCVRLTFEDGRQVECTREHKFVINGEWKACSEARIGAEFLATARDTTGTDNSLLGGSKAWAKGMHWTDGERMRLNGKSSEMSTFKLAMKGQPCEDCGASGGRMEAHHNDFQGGKERPADLAWLCNSCHKTRHIDHGDRRPPYARGHRPTEPAILSGIEPIGKHETYDLEMPAPNHNFVLANGLVTHNSHTVSYAIISYWCAYLKHYHQLEYAAACLRSAKDDESPLQLLRELVKEGVRYDPFDIDLSDVDWKVVSGRLVGGFKNLKGYGPVKAVTAVEQRRLGTLDREKVLAAECLYTDLFPLHTHYGDWYRNPMDHGIRMGWPITEIADMEDAPSKRYPYEYVVLCKVLEKERRDENETIRLQRRGGRIIPGQPLFVDLAVTDDSGMPCTLRIDRFNYEPLGRLCFERLEPGDVLLVRGMKIVGFPMLKSGQIKCLTRPDVFMEN